jgi:hypothetical protein
MLLRFEDGVEGVVDLGKLIRFEGVFAPLRDRGEFARLTVNAELGTICWPNGADLDPNVLYAQVTRKANPGIRPAASPRVSNDGRRRVEATITPPSFLAIRKRVGFSR